MYTKSGVALYAFLGTKPNLLRRTLRRLGGQIILLAFILFDIGSLGFALVAPVWLAPWVTINLTALVLGTLSWSENGRMQREIATAMQRQTEKIRSAERECEALRQRQAEQQAEQAEHLRQAEQQLSEAEERRRHEKEEHEALRQLQAEQAERLHQVEQQLRESEEQLRQEEKERETLRQLQAELAERLCQAEERREAERRRRPEKRQAQRDRRGERKRARFQADWWSVLGVAPSASKDDIVRNFRRRIKQCHPDRVVGLAPEFLELAEEHTKVLNEAYENAMRCHQGPALC